MTAGAAGTSSRHDLDPQDWDEFRALSHTALDDMITFLQQLRQRRAWTEAPAQVRRRFEADLPQTGSGLSEVLQEFERSIKPYATGNTHPSFMGWVHGGGTPVGMLAEMLAAGLNANCGGRNHIGIDVEQQVTRWMRELFRFPETASGLFVTGTSMANFVALLVARNHALGTHVRDTGLGQTPQLCAYASAAVHGCVGQAMDMAGIGAGFLRRVPCNAAGEMDPKALESRIAADRADGHLPFLVVATVGSVDTGAIDPLVAVADSARRHGLWFHVDGAFGAMAALSPTLRPMLDGIERADSIAFDFHKWVQVPYDAGFVLVRDREAHRRSFAAQNGYLSRAEAGLAAGGDWPCDFGPDLSRGFRALKTWFTFKVFGVDRLAGVIENSCALARRLERAIAASPRFELAAPVRLNIVCFTIRGLDADDANRRIVEALHVSGQAVPSVTTLAGRAVIRCAIVNHRTTEADIDRFVDDVHRCAERDDDVRLRPQTRDPGSGRG